MFQREIIDPIVSSVHAEGESGGGEAEDAAEHPGQRALQAGHQRPGRRQRRVALGQRRVHHQLAGAHQRPERAGHGVRLHLERPVSPRRRPRHRAAAAP